jgi:hypothetical protein
VYAGDDPTGSVITTKPLDNQKGVITYGSKRNSHMVYNTLTDCKLINRTKSLKEIYIAKSVGLLNPVQKTTYSYEVDHFRKYGVSKTYLQKRNVQNLIAHDMNFYEATVKLIEEQPQLFKPNSIDILHEKSLIQSEVIKSVLKDKNNCRLVSKSLDNLEGISKGRHNRIFTDTIQGDNHSPIREVSNSLEASPDTKILENHGIRRVRYKSFTDLHDIEKQNILTLSKGDKHFMVIMPIYHKDNINNESTEFIDNEIN